MSKTYFDMGKNLEGPNIFGTLTVSDYGWYLREISAKSGSWFGIDPGVAERNAEHQRRNQELIDRLRDLTLAGMDATFDPPDLVDPPAKAPLSPDFGMDAEYLKVAQAIGLDSPAVLRAELEAFLAEQFIGVYPLESVDKYMRSLAQKQGKVWVWKPLRSKDQAVVGALYHPPFSVFNAQHGSMAPMIYPHAVPLPVLSTVQRIIERFGDRVQFFVSDYEAPKPDPFLMVTAQGLPVYCIERWDEPSFRA